jgi:hypothetical protein
MWHGHSICSVRDLQPCPMVHTAKNMVYSSKTQPELFPSDDSQPKTPISHGQHYPVFPCTSYKGPHFQ